MSSRAWTRKAAARSQRSFHSRSSAGLTSRTAVISAPYLRASSPSQLGTAALRLQRAGPTGFSGRAGGERRRDLCPQRRLARYETALQERGADGEGVDAEG